MSELVEVTVGVIGRAHGIKGEVTIEIRTDEVERRFVPGVELTTETGRRLTLVGTRWASDRLLGRFEQVPDRTAAEQLRGASLLTQVPVDELPSGDDEYFDRQLIGLDVLNADGMRVGSITEVVHGPAQDLFVVDVDGTERLVPFVTDLVPVVDLTAGHVQLANVAGLLEDIEDA